MKRLGTLLMATSLVLAFSAIAAVAGGNSWEDAEVIAHGHVMLIGADATDGTWDRCIEFGNGKALRTAAHHNSVHTGAAGGSPFAQGALFNAGKLVVPLAPFPFVPAEWQGCDDIPNPIFGD